MGALRYNDVVTTGFVRLGAILSFVGVALGAFGAHILQEKLHMTPRYLDVYRTGIQYHMIHAVALVFVGLFAERSRSRSLVLWSGRLFAAGIVLFGGSLYALALTSLLACGPVKILGAITPLGGVCFLVGWALLAVAAKDRERNA